MCHVRGAFLDKTRTVTPYAAQGLEGLDDDGRGWTSTFFRISDFFAASGSSPTSLDAPQPATAAMSRAIAPPRRQRARHGREVLVLIRFMGRPARPHGRCTANPPARGRGDARQRDRRTAPVPRGVKGSIRAPRPSRGRADVGAGRSSDSRAQAPGLLIEPASVARLGPTMAVE